MPARARVATLYLEAASPGWLAPTATAYLAMREARKISPPALARCLADRLAIAAQGSAHPLEGMIGSPTLLVAGLELRG